MSAVQRVTTLVEPPIVGRFYLVPTVKYEWGGWLNVWPVFLPKHDDAEHLDFPWPHYHVDPRFLTTRQRRSVTAGSLWLGEARWRGQVERTAQNTPLGAPSRYAAAPAMRPTPSIVWRRRKCAQSRIEFHFGPQVDRVLRPAYAGRICRRSKNGLICPHKRFALGSLPAEAGVITCPLHGLRIDAETGRVLGVGERE